MLATVWRRIISGPNNYIAKWVFNSLLGFFPHNIYFIFFSFHPLSRRRRQPDRHRQFGCIKRARLRPQTPPPPPPLYHRYTAPEIRSRCARDCTCNSTAMCAGITGDTLPSRSFYRLNNICKNWVCVCVVFLRKRRPQKKKKIIRIYYTDARRRWS